MCKIADVCLACILHIVYIPHRNTKGRETFVVHVLSSPEAGGVTILACELIRYRVEYRWCIHQNFQVSLRLLALRRGHTLARVRWLCVVTVSGDCCDLPCLFAVCFGACMLWRVRYCRINFLAFAWSQLRQLLRLLRGGGVYSLK